MGTFIFFVIGVATGFILNSIKSKKETPQKKNDLLSEAIVSANLINLSIDHLLSEIEADRIWIAQFHNGGNYYPTGKSIQKFSFFYETVRLSKYSVQMNFQNVPVNLFSRALGHISEHNLIEIPDYKDTEANTHGLKRLAEIHKAKSSYLFSIHNLENKLIAILGIDYVENKKKLEPEQITKVQLESAKIGGVLTSYL